MTRLMSAAVLGALVGFGAAAAEVEKLPSLKEIMSKQSKGPKSLTILLKPALNADEPDWAKIQKQTKEFSALSTSLTKHDVPLGSKDSWAKLTTAYADDSNELDAAAQKKDQKAAQAAFAKISGSCMGCHKAHRKKKT